MSILQKDLYVEGTLGTNFTVNALNTKLYEDTGTSDQIKIVIKGIANGVVEQDYISSYGDLIDIPLHIRKKENTDANQTLYVNINNMGIIQCIIRPFSGPTTVMPENILQAGDIFTATYDGEYFIIEGANVQVVANAEYSGGLSKYGFAAPDYYHMGTTNLISAVNGTWTADKDGFVKVGTSLAMFEDSIWSINGKTVMNQSSAVGGKSDGIFAVIKGDVVKNISPAGTTGIFCYFIPSIKGSGSDSGGSGGTINAVDVIDYNQYTNLGTLAGATQQVINTATDLTAGKTLWKDLSKNIAAANLQTEINALPKAINGTVNFFLPRSSVFNDTLTIEGFTGSGSISIYISAVILPVNPASIKAIKIQNNSIKSISIVNITITGTSSEGLDYGVYCENNTSNIKLSQILSSSAQTYGIYCSLSQNVRIDVCNLYSKQKAFVSTEAARIYCSNVSSDNSPSVAFEATKGGIIGVDTDIPSSAVFNEATGGRIFQHSQTGSLKTLAPLTVFGTIPNNPDGSKASVRYMIYDNGGENWCGMGVNYSGEWWLRVGITNSGQSILYLGNDPNYPLRLLKGYSAGTGFANSYNIATMESGTWTPTLVGNITVGNVTYSTQIGRYFRIGNLVMTVSYIGISTKTTMPDGILRVQGFPIINSTSSTYIPLTLGYFNGWINRPTDAYIEPGGNSALLRREQTTSQGTDMATTGLTTLMVTGLYSV